MADAQVLCCPQCGAPAQPGAMMCAYCKAALETVACPSCFGMMYLGSKFCPRCGARAASVLPRHEAADCPRCKTAMTASSLGGCVLDQCGSCGGVWLDSATFARIREDREAQAAFVGPGAEAQVNVLDPTAQPVLYLPCPRCGDLMNRVNFAGSSGIVIDTCRSHGTWFDKDELPAVVEFIRGGGLEQARREELDRLRGDFDPAPPGVAEAIAAQPFEPAPAGPQAHTMVGRILRSLLS